MNWLLFATLLAMTAAVYMLNDGAFLHPGVIVSAVFTLSAFFVCLNPEWQIVISVKTYLVIAGGILLFLIGCQIGGCVELNFKILRNDRVDRISLPRIVDIADQKKLMWFVDLICIGVTALYFRNQYRVSVELGNRNGVAGMIGTLRSAVLVDSDAFQLGGMLNIGLAFCRAAGFICLFLLIGSFFTHKGKKRHFIIPVACLLTNIVLQTGRGALIGIVTTVIYNIFFVAKTYSGKEINRKIIKYAAIGFLLFFVLFRLLGTLTGKTAVWSFWDTLSIYAGSSIVCLDNFLNGTWTLSSLFGVKTFKGIYGLLNTLGFSVPAASNHAEMFRWQTYSSNVYSSFFPYLQDFGIAGTLVVEILVGLMCGFVWKRYLSRNNSYFLAVTYGHFWGASLVYYSIAERLFTNNLALHVFVEVFFFFVLIRLLCKRTVQ